MKCKEIQPELVAYYYNELETEKLNLIGNHLKGCHLCQEALKEIEKTLAMVGKRIDIPRSEKFWNAYLDKVYQRIEEDSFLSGLYRNIFIEPKLAPILVASLLILILAGSSSLYLINKNKKYEQMQLAQNIELFRDFEVIEDLDLLNNLELLEETDINEEKV